MGVLDRFLERIKLNEDYDEEEDFLEEDAIEDEDEDFLEEEDSKIKKNFFQKFTSRKSTEEESPEPEEEPEKTVSASKNDTRPSSSRTSMKTERTPRTSSKITPMRSSRRSGQTNNNMEVCVIKPTSMEDSREIADTLVDNCTVILNLEGLDMELAQRIIDFTSGACYSLGGTLQQISSYIFVLGPYNVEITGDLRNILGGSSPSVRAGY